MATKDDGGPAFPFDRKLRSFAGQEGDRITEVEGDDGMSLRDWFAAQALQPLVAKMLDSDVERTPETWAKCGASACVAAYSIADAMILARKQ